MDKLNLNKDNLRTFGITMGIAFLVISGIIALRHKHNALSASLISAIFFIFALGYPLLLKPVYIIWMKFAFILGWINTRLMLLIIFYLVFTPIGLVIRLCGIDLLDRKIQKYKESYWRRKEKKEFNPGDYGHQF